MNEPIHGIAWLWLAYRSFDVIYCMQLINAAIFVLFGSVSILVPFLAILTFFLERYLQNLLKVHDVNDDNFEDKLL